MKFLFFFLLNLYELHAWYWLEGNCFLYFILFSILTAGLFLVIGFGVECYLHLLFLSIHQILKSALTTPIYTQITNPFLSFKHLLSLPSLASQFFHVTLWSPDTIHYQFNCHHCQYLNQIPYQLWGPSFCSQNYKY